MDTGVISREVAYEAIRIIDPELKAILKKLKSGDKVTINQKYNISDQDKITEVHINNTFENEFGAIVLLRRIYMIDFVTAKEIISYL